MKNSLIKIIDILTPANRRGIFILINIMLIGMLLEMIGVGLILPVIAILTQKDAIVSYPELQPILGFLGNPGYEDLVVSVMLLLLIVYLIKNIFLAFLAWTQNRFIFNLQSELSQRLFSLYLRQPYTFHLQRNSAYLVRNVRTEVGMFTGSVIQPATMIFSEGLVLVGICSLLMIVEPIGILIVMMVLGVAGWGFYRSTKRHITRWGKARQHHDGLSLQHLNQGLGGAKDVKLLGREIDFLNEFAVHTSRSARMNQLQTTLKQIPRLWLELLGVIGLVVLVLIMLEQDRDMNTILPTLGLFATAAFRLMPSVNRILGAVQQLRYGHPALDILHEELKLLVKEKTPNVQHPTPNVEPLRGLF